MSGPDALTRSVLADQVKERLLEAILDGSYPPDSRIVETAVAKELGTSQAPVREALRGLEALGIVEIMPFRGARVRRLDPAGAARGLRRALGDRGAGGPAGRGPDDRRGRRGAAGDRRQPCGGGEVRATGAPWPIIDASLHEKMMELSGNGTLLRVWRSLEPMSAPTSPWSARASDPQWSADLHDPMLDADPRPGHRGRRPGDRESLRRGPHLAGREPGREAPPTTRRTPVPAVTPGR